MADYVQSIDFSAKDALPTGDAGKAAKGADIDTELALIATAIASKVDESREGQASGIATLGADSLVPDAQLPTASLTVNGIVELATGAETITGSSESIAVTPGGLNALLTQGAGLLLDFAALTDPDADRILFWDDSAGAATWLTASTGLVLSGTALTVDHDAATNFVADEHIPHSSIDLVAGSGLTGGGTIAASRTFAVGAGDGISVTANAVAVDSTVARTSGDTFTGAVTFSDDAILSGSFRTTNSVTKALSVGELDNYNPGADVSVVRFTTTAGGDNNLTGLAGGVDGRRIVLLNTGTTVDITLLNEDAGSTAANRFICNAAGATIGALEGCEVIYDGAANRWRIIFGAF